MLLGSCLPGSDEKKIEILEATISDQAVGPNFSLHVQDNQLYMIYPSLDALSLNLSFAEILPESLQPTPEQTKYLDRISYSPDIGETFGKHLFLVSDPYYHILYVDQESQDNSVLKWLSKTDEDESWWIDAFPGLTDPLAAGPEPEGNLEVVFSEGRNLSLYRLHATAQPELIATTSLPSGARRTVEPVSRRRPGSGSTPTRIFGPLRSCRMPMDRPVSSLRRLRTAMRPL